MQACEPQLGALIDAASGELPESARRDLDTHLAGCAGCREELAAMSRTEELLRRTSNAPEDIHLAGFALRVADRAEAFRDRSVRGLWWALTRAMRFSMGFSTAAATVALVLFVQSRQPSAPEVVIAKAAPAPVVTAQVQDSDDEASIDDPEQVAEEDGAEPFISLDSALDSLTPEQLNELARKLAANAG